MSYYCFVILCNVRIISHSISGSGYRMVSIYMNLFLSHRWIFPIIGHMGIANTSGIIRDFAGPYFVSEDDMAFGWPTKYWILDPYRAQGGPTAFDRSIALASEEYQGRMVRLIFLYSICLCSVDLPCNFVLF